jgi:DNA-binding MarR family transcriptional regulator
VDPVALRIQHLANREQVLVLARLAESRQEGPFAPVNIGELFDESALPKPSVSVYLGRLEKENLVTRAAAKKWRLTPAGRKASSELANDMDLAALTAEAAVLAPVLAHTAHPVIPPSFAPPDLIRPLHEFLAEFAFESNVFGMTRFPQTTDGAEDEDPVAPALRIAREVCAEHGVTFHLASDRQIVDDLWPNVAAHMWACKYGIAFFEDRADPPRGINYNLNIEVGSMLVLGRRVGILKDRSVEKLPTDLTGKIWKGIDLGKLSTVKQALSTALKADFKLGK